MATIMEHAFARARGIHLSSDAPEGAGSNPQDIIVIIKGVQFSLIQIMNGVALPTGDIDTHTLELAIPALSLKERKYTLRDGVYYFEKSGRIPKAIEYLGYESGDPTIRNIDRELVTVLKGDKDNFMTEAGMIKHLRNLLLRLLADNNGSRKILQENKNRALNLVARINNALEGRVQDLTLESDAKSFYEHITESLGFTEIDHMVIRALSWEWKNRPIYRNHPYACRMWIIVLGLFRLVR